MPSEKTLYFDSDGFTLAGTLHLPDSQTPPVVVGCHGLLANRQSVKQISLAHACNNIGMAYFRFDHRGCGDSDGQFVEVTTLAARVQDLCHAITAMKDHSQTGSVAALFGSSFGGTVVLSYAAENPSPAISTYAAPVDSTSIQHENIRDNNGGSPPSSLLTEALTFDIRPQLERVKNALISHSQGDETVPVEHAREIYRICKDPRELLIFDGGDHRMSSVAHQKQFETHFVRWITTAGE